MKDGFLKAAALSPALRVADCTYNTAQIIQQLREAAGRGVKLAVFPEFCLTGYTCGDLFLQRTLQQGALTGLQAILDASREVDVVALVGLPLLARGSALRFLLTRLYDWLNHPPGAFVQPKDPLEYLKKLTFHQQAKSIAAYGL